MFIRFNRFIPQRRYNVGHDYRRRLDPQRDLVDPAVRGTRTVLESCRRAGTVKRVVVTSSVAAITDEPDQDHELTEADWNTKSSLTSSRMSSIFHESLMAWMKRFTSAMFATWHFVA